MSICNKEGCSNPVTIRVSAKGNQYVYKICKEHVRQGQSERIRANSIKRNGNVVKKRGYVYIRDEDGCLKPRYRMVMEEKLGRPLIAGESVHHKNGIRDDDSPENLELWIGAIRYGQRAIELNCKHCGKPYLENEY